MIGTDAKREEGGRDGNLVRAAIEELARRWRVLLAFPLGAAVLVVALSFLVEPRYEGVAVFGPAEDVSQPLPASLQSIAAQFGFAVPSAGYSVYYFAQVVQSRAVLERVCRDTLEVAGNKYAVLRLLQASGDTPEQWLESGVKALGKLVDVRTDDQADLVTLRVQAPSPGLAQALTRSVLDALDSVTSATQRTGGSYERRFAEAQADSARQALGQAENQLRDFYQANRSIQSSPTLQVEEARLRRQIQIHQDVYLALVNQTEAAKLREARNTPAISVVQQPLASIKKVSPRRSVWALSALIGAFLLAAGWLYVIIPAMAGSSLRAQPGIWSKVLNA